MSVPGNMTVQGRLLRDEPMSRHTSWRVGGSADLYYIPADMHDLQDFLAGLAPRTAITWVGLGSNLLVRDGGIRGVVIAPLNALNSIERHADGQVYAAVGVTCARLAKFCHRQNLAGVDFLAGIPGTIGGALAMNAGAFGGSTWNHVKSAHMINRQGQLFERAACEFEVGYRSVSQFDDEWFTGACFGFEAKAGTDPSNIKALLQQRNASQPVGQASCGSVFKNPPGHHAAQLIEASGLKGQRYGSACVSSKHANFIISDEGASAADIEALMQLIQTRVLQQFDIQLEMEVRIIGEAL